MIEKELNRKKRDRKSGKDNRGRKSGIDRDRNKEWNR